MADIHSPDTRYVASWEEDQREMIPGADARLNQVTLNRTPVAYMFTVRQANPTMVVTFAALEYMLNPGEVLISKKPLYFGANDDF